MKYSIGITTYEHRFEKFFKPLVNQIKALRPDVEIIVTVNGEVDGLSDDYRKSVLEFCASHKNVLPIVYPEFRSLCKLWNNILVNSSNHIVLVLNDDVGINDESFFTALENLDVSHPPLYKINGTWSHFLTDRRIINQLGWFDERFLCIGEEDGDMEWRLGKATGHKTFPAIEMPGIVNHVDSADNCLKGIAKANVKYSQFNLYFIHNVKYAIDNENGEQYGINPRKLVCKNPTPPQYLTESFFWDNKHLLKENHE